MLTAANRVREVRVAKGLTQGQLAERLGVKANAVTGLENETRSLRMPTLRRVAAALGVPITELLPMLDRPEVSHEV